MARREQSRLRRPTSKLGGDSSTPLPPKRKAKSGVGAVHPNSMAARKMGLTAWTYVGERTAATGSFATREAIEEELRLKRSREKFGPSQLST